MVFPIVGGDGKPTGYDIENSLRFNDADLHYLERTFDSSGSQRTFTVSCWIKRSELSTGNNTIWAAAPSNGGQLSLQFNSSDQLILREYNTTDEEVLNLVTSGLFRDPAAWYHIVAAVDTTDGTASNRAKLYVNGTLQALGTATYPNQNYDLLMNNTTNTGKFFVGNETYASTSAVFDGYIAEFYIINNSQLAPTSFGETDDNGVWIPTDASGDLTFGHNGVYLEFKQTGTGQNSSGIGADTSGEDHHFAIANNNSAFASTDITTDTPTNNFCTYNPNDPGSGSTFSEGNLATNTGDNKNDIGTIGFQNGKWYWEVKCAGSGIVGVQHESVNHLNGTNLNDDVGSVAVSSYHGTIFHNNNQDTTPGTDQDGCIIGCAVDMDNNKIYWHKDGTYYDTSGGTQNPVTGANPITVATGTNTVGFWFPKLAAGTGSQTFETNFGNPSFAISSGNADDNGYGNFEYDVPTGYYAICTKNLAEYG